MEKKEIIIANIINTFNFCFISKIERQKTKCKHGSLNTGTLSGTYFLSHPPIVLDEIMQVARELI